MSTGSSTDFTRLFDVVSYQLAKYPQHRAVNAWKNGQWLALSAQELDILSDRVACWFIRQGYRPGTRIAEIPRSGSVSWLVIDLALQKAGLIVVPIHATAPAREMAFILNEVQAPLCITADAGLYYKVLALSSDIPYTKAVYHLETELPGYLPAFMTKPDAGDQTELQARKRQVGNDDVCAILYTSGTSGDPKGVMLTHDNIVSNIKAILPLLPVKPGQRALSFLPFSHVFERTTCYTYLALGVEIYFNPSRDALAQSLLSAKPHFFTAVPKTLERMYAYLQEQRLQKNPIRRWLFTWAMRIGEKYDPVYSGGVLYRVQLHMARWLVLNRWKRPLGGHTQFIMVGAAALRPEIARLFSAAGVLALSGYGMTEASPYISFNRPQPGLFRFGTVGIALPGVEIRINGEQGSAEGEILVRGPNVMKGYFQRDELTRTTLAGGWLHTGDVGRLEENCFLIITGRKKEIFKTSAGLYVSPLELENHFTASPFISQCMVLGFNKPFVAALIVPDFRILQAWCREKDIHWTSPAYMIHNVRVIQKMQEEMDRLNEPLENYKRIRKFVLLPDEWSAESGELTASFKLMREQVMQKFRKEIDRMYG